MLSFLRERRRTASAAARCRHLRETRYLAWRFDKRQSERLSETPSYLRFAERTVRGLGTYRPDVDSPKEQVKRRWHLRDANLPAFRQKGNNQRLCETPSCLRFGKGQVKRREHLQGAMLAFR